ncbi:MULTISPECIES: GTPase Era [unclassified Sphingomonas]|uniref:GTPase Era n=1 Tax=unclassified Sphingomonas TaxID=196159 RepID=UPI001F569D1D|nr:MULTISPECIES: GTPase Era [unclassified Sphingomonas]
MTETQHCGLVAVVGAPNAGKSTLVNALVGQKVAIVSPKAQTTRAKLLGVAIEGATQLLLVDTPGIFAPQRRLDRAMVAAAWSGTEGADVIALVVDGKGGLPEKVVAIVESLKDRPEPVHLILNKVDIAAKPKLLLHAERLNAIRPFAETWFVSAETGDGVPELKRAFAALMPEGPWHYPEDQVSDATERALASEVTREQLYLQLHAELPYASTIETERYDEREDGSVEIHQQILVERPTQRAIVLGKGGQRIKEIGARARAELTTITGRPVHLYLHVKVKPGWDEDRETYRDIGLDWVD